MSEKIVQLNEEVLKGISFETAIIERYRRRESSVEEALIEMYLAGGRSGVWRTSSRPCGAARYLRLPSVKLNKKAYFTLRIGGTVLCRVGAIRMCM